MCASSIVTVLPYNSVNAAAVAPACCRLRIGGGVFAGWPSGQERSFCFWQSSFRFATNICSLARRMMPARRSSVCCRSGVSRVRPRLKTSRLQLSTPPLAAATASSASTSSASAPSSAVRPMAAGAELTLVRPMAASRLGEPVRSAFFSSSWRLRFFMVLGLLTNTSRSSICSTSSLCRGSRTARYARCCCGRALSASPAVSMGSETPPSGSSNFLTFALLGAHKLQSLADH
mmetsp:Transcript_104892/g.313390  ORF Transcript_104892/g.313390 Transcript_104892/m.313390 type:complete len:232 (+) Transcript_104892:263-958(+)